MSRQLLLDHLDKPDIQSLTGYSNNGGYESLRKALQMKPEEIVSEVQKSGLRGRGGAGFLQA
jgi:NADH-quinone oxidoreductase subunit F